MRCLINFWFCNTSSSYTTERKKERKKDRQISESVFPFRQKIRQYDGQFYGNSA